MSVNRAKNCHLYAEIAKFGSILHMIFFLGGGVGDKLGKMFFGGCHMPPCVAAMLQFK